MIDTQGDKEDWNKEFVLHVFPKKKELDSKFLLAEKIVAVVDSIPDKYLEMEVDNLRKALGSDAKSSGVLQSWNNTLIDYQNDILKFDGDMRYVTGFVKGSYHRKIFVCLDIRRDVVLSVLEREDNLKEDDLTQSIEAVLSTVDGHKTFSTLFIKQLIDCEEDDDSVLTSLRSILREYKGGNYRAGWQEGTHKEYIFVEKIQKKGE